MLTNRHGIETATVECPGCKRSFSASIELLREAADHSVLAPCPWCEFGRPILPVAMLRKKRVKKGRTVTEKRDGEPGSPAARKILSMLIGGFTMREIVGATKQRHSSVYRIWLRWLVLPTLVSLADEIRSGKMEVEESLADRIQTALAPAKVSCKEVSHARAHAKNQRENRDR